ncbi:4'-phosphopantetheinyl transferase [Cystobacter fuscus DSM 2262]|uniref:4'-phosphopantetheinyl transferase n=1 Tax=Cystobacter fuscus (strain ATCC 25194 / DSM 2262 / NBRC 100088 / M29) TaxID=1242864 RepID=S9Q407_CYSF2|nr:4'-phosphopantetheinyl transferase superfamily protein [Cystobacter fuscus]EPX56039.1 4'-phosphopantetheinyl transferase [Cystobacter fuscus DSM 2262]
MSLPPSPAPSPLPRPDEVHLWIVEPERVTEPRLLAAYLALLGAEERERHQRFRFEKHRQQFLVSHALVRVCLSRYAPVAPRDWRFSTNAYGRPEIAGEGMPRLRFNLSHTDGMAVCAVAHDMEVGADVEHSGRMGQTVELAESFFAPSEVADLHSLPEALQRERFFDYWTLKESYIKARGAGLSLPLDQFSFHLAPGQPPRISFDARMVDEPESWQFVQLRLSAEHPAAVAVRRPRGLPLSVRCQRCVPLASEESPWRVDSGDR